MRLERRVLLVLACLVTSGTLATTVGGSPSTTGPDTQPAVVVNDRCPVMPEERASPVHQLIYRGVAVRFCCRECKDRFIQEPTPFLSRLPHVPPEAPQGVTRAAAAEAPSEKRHRRWSRYLELGSELVERHRGVILVGLAALAVNGWAARRSRRRQLSAGTVGVPANQMGARQLRIRSRALAVLGHPLTAVAILAAVALPVAGEWHRSAVASAADAAASSRPPGTTTAGDNSINGRFLAEMARQGILQGTAFVAAPEKTYYRGNDDRDPRLYNGGIYCTGLFHIRLCAEDGSLVRPGMNVAGSRLSLRVQIERAPNTLASHFRG